MAVVVGTRAWGRGAERRGAIRSRAQPVCASAVALGIRGAGIAYGVAPSRSSRPLRFSRPLLLPPTRALLLLPVPRRFGVMAAQAKAFFDATGSKWSTGGLQGKFAGTIVSTATQNGGQETTHLTAYTQFTHHGMVIVPAGYIHPSLQFNNDYAHGAWRGVRWRTELQWYSIAQGGRAALQRA